MTACNNNLAAFLPFLLGGVKKLPSLFASETYEINFLNVWNFREKLVYPSHKKCISLLRVWSFLLAQSPKCFYMSINLQSHVPIKYTCRCKYKKKRGKEKKHKLTYNLSNCNSIYNLKRNITSKYMSFNQCLQFMN